MALFFKLMSTTSSASEDTSSNCSVSNTCSTGSTSSAHSDNSDLPTTSTSPRDQQHPPPRFVSVSTRSQKRVSFNEKVQIRRSGCRFSKKEISACWYSWEDLDRMRQESDRAQRRLQRSILKRKMKERGAQDRCSLSRVLKDTTISDFNQETTQNVEERFAKKETTTCDDIAQAISETEANIRKLEEHRDALRRELSRQGIDKRCRTELDMLISSTAAHICALEEHNSILKLSQWRQRGVSIKST